MSTTAPSPSVIKLIPCVPHVIYKTIQNPRGNHAFLKNGMFRFLGVFGKLGDEAGEAWE